MNLINNENVRRFIDEVKTTCKKHNITLLLSDKPYVDFNSVQSSGFFSDTIMTLAVGTGKSPSLWIPTLVHEYCHMLQWASGSKVWTDLTLSEGSADDILDNWLNGKEVSDEVINMVIDVIIAVELDCEKRTVEKIKEFNLPIDIETYIKQSNSYVLFYHEVKKSRKWYTAQHAPYLKESIWQKMPADFTSLDYMDPLVLETLPSFKVCFGEDQRTV